MTCCEKYHEQYWTYDYCREVEPGIFNQYEMVRLSINPVSGQLVGCVVFYVPLLDDHRPEDVPLTQEQAEAVVSNRVLEGNVLAKAQITIGMPNWFFSDTVNAKASGVTRWCWMLVYERPNSEYADRTIFLVDLYTGELLGGDMTG